MWKNLKSLHTSLKNKIRGSQTYRVEVDFDCKHTTENISDARILDKCIEDLIQKLVLK